MENLVLITHPKEFKQGTRILMRTLRSKDGGKVNKPDRVAEKLVSRNEEEFDELFAQLLAKRTGQERIYSTVDARNMSKAIRQFKYDQLDADYYDKESHASFYVDIYNRWISALQSPQSREGTLFLWDIDEDNMNPEGLTTIYESIRHNNIEIIDDYPTKHGKHLITKPFNPNIVSFYGIKKNAMMLWAYEK